MANSVSETLPAARQQQQNRSFDDQTDDTALVQAASFTSPFLKIANIVGDSPAPKRPNRHAPIHNDDASMLERELVAWDAASDEDFASFERGLAKDGE